MDYKEIGALIECLDKDALDGAKDKWDQVAKPVGSLGRLEGLITRICGIQRSVVPDISKRCVVVSCADNGVTKQGITMTDSSVTAIMTSYIAKKRSSVGSMAKKCDTDVITCDCGMFAKLDDKSILDHRAGDGTADMSIGPAMTKDQADTLINRAITLVARLRRNGYKLIATGEMGIGNTATTSAVTAALLGVDPELTTGPGVGLSDKGLKRKVAVIKKAITVNAPDKDDPLDVLCKVGGFDIVHMTGLYLGAALNRIPIVIDGVISAVAALCAYRLCPKSLDYMLPSHISAEPAFGLIMDELGLSPVLD
ncbi:MAG: nicotinate-nucleotide--dimethylbenzimidazole phosphoribosyltransferase, partial [Dehalococcoidales bacterium]|nr:nicotinate-nucleotide--dimethylbenzimidazole phosphoribosyltransferase [Dehalococcoidales bacterium]